MLSPVVRACIRYGPETAKCNPFPSKTYTSSTRATAPRRNLIKIPPPHLRGSPPGSPIGRVACSVINALSLLRATWLRITYGVVRGIRGSDGASLLASELCAKSRSYRYTLIDSLGLPLCLTASQTDGVCDISKEQESRLDLICGHVERRNRRDETVERRNWRDETVERRNRRDSLHVVAGVHERFVESSDASGSFL